MKRFLLFLLLACGLRAQVPTLQDFGYESIQAMGRPARGTVPLLVVQVQLTGYPDLAFGNNYWDNRIFAFSGPGGTRTMNGYYLENSLGAFYFTRALTTTPAPVILNAAETSRIMTPGYDSDDGREAMFDLITAKAGIPWVQWDTNNDGVITQGELCIMVLTNFNHPVNGEGEGHARGLTWSVPAVPPAQSLRLDLSVTLMCNRVSLMTLAHEMLHCLGVRIDLYGYRNRNGRLTLMGATIFGPDDDQTSMHLDPWYKMRMGWLRPRIFNLDDGGEVTLRCPQSPFAATEAEGPVILYSPSRGSTEYFMLEWRNSAPPAGGKYDAHVELGVAGGGSGVAVWHVRQDAAHNPLLMLSGTLWSAYHLSPAVPVPAPPALDGIGVPNNAAWYNQGNFNLGGQVLWRGATPPLRWDDGTVSTVNVIPGAILEGGNARRVEWRSSAVHWADFFSNPPSPDGSFANPWPTVNAAIAYTPRGATLNIKSSSTAAPIIINKPMILQAPLNGPAVIGQ